MELDGFSLTETRDTISRVAKHNQTAALYLDYQYLRSVEK